MNSNRGPAPARDGSRAAPFPHAPRYAIPAGGGKT